MGGGRFGGGRFGGLMVWWFDGLVSRGRESAGAGPRVRMQQSPGLFGPFG